MTVSRKSVLGALLKRIRPSHAQPAAVALVTLDRAGLSGVVAGVAAAAAPVRLRTSSADGTDRSNAF